MDSQLNSNRVLCVGVGNCFRRDDSAGLYIVRTIQDQVLTHLKKEPESPLGRLRFSESSGEGTSMMDSWRGFDSVVLFDAVMKQGNPGTKVHFQASNDHFPSDFFKYSSHAFSLSEAVELARILGLLPAKLEVFGVEGADFGYGEEITSDVKSACDEIAARFVKDQMNAVEFMNN